MATTLHSLAPHDLPSFIPQMDGGDRLMVVMAVFLIVMVVVAGVIYLNIHSLPERRLHGTEKVQFEIVAILALVSLLTHNHLFWIAALILAFVHVPDFASPLRSMADSLDRMSRGDAPAPGDLPPEGGEPVLPDAPEDRADGDAEGETTNA